MLPCCHLQAPSFAEPWVVMWHCHPIFVVVGVHCVHCGWWWVVAVVGNGGDVVHLVVVDNGGS